MEFNPEDASLMMNGTEVETICNLPGNPPWPPIDVGDDGKFELEDGRIVRFTVYQVEKK